MYIIYIYNICLLYIYIFICNANVELKKTSARLNPATTWKQSAYCATELLENIAKYINIRIFQTRSSQNWLKNAPYYLYLLKY